MVFQERPLTCVECNNTFPFTVEDQQYHAEKGYTNEPKRCPSCRDARRADRRGSSSGGFGGGPRQMHSVVCAQCGKDAEVPFQPTGDRPVYCSDCYRQRGPSSGGFSSYR